MGQRLLVSVFLIKALGGDWHERREQTPLVQSKTLSPEEVVIRWPDQFAP
jgi:hypothetical protein